MTRADFYSDMEIIGSTVVPAPDTLPMCLSPIYRRKGDSDKHYVPVDESDPDDPQVVEEDASWLEQGAADEEVVLLSTPIQARAEHKLIQFEWGAPPRYLPVADIDAALNDAYREAMKASGQFLREKKRVRAEERAWYAARAGAGQALPLLTLISLLRGEIPERKIAFLEQDVRSLPPVVRSAVRVELLAMREPGRAILSMLEGDPFARAEISAEDSRRQVKTEMWANLGRSGQERLARATRIYRPGWLPPKAAA